MQAINAVTISDSAVQKKQKANPRAAIQRPQCGQHFSCEPDCKPQPGHFMESLLMTSG